MENFEILWELQKMWHKDTKWANVGKMMPIDLLDTGCPKPSIGKKTHYLWSAIKWSIIKHGMPILQNNLHSKSS